MVRSRAAVLAALAVVAAAVTPAAAAADPDWTGFVCGFMATNDPVGAVEADRDRWYGTIDGGPVTVTSSDPVVSVTITCAIQVDEADFSGTDVVSVSATGSGAAAVLPPTAMTYRSSPADQLYLCTTVSAVTRSGSYTWNVDSDDWLPGPQCDDGLRTGPV